MEFRKINKEDVHMSKIAYIHNQTPKAWIKGYQVKEEDVQNTLKRLQREEQENVYVAVAEEKGKLLGFIWGEKTADKFMILSLYTEPAFRKQKIATKLKEMLEEWALENEISVIQTTVHYTNQNMISLNEKMGYRPGMVWMEKRIEKKN